MILQQLDIKNRLESRGILYSKDEIYERPTVIGYEKKFQWLWFGTQLNTFVFATDFDDTLITPELFAEYMNESFKYAEQHHTGWPRGLQSSVGAISILISSNIHKNTIEYCRELQSEKHWSGFGIPVVVNSSTNKVYFFDKKPMWGAIYYPHFKRLIRELT